MGTFEIQRLNMVESQVRPSDVTDRRILHTMLALPRERFVPTAQQPLAYMEGAIPITGATGKREMLAPRTLARLIQLAAIEPTDRVLHLAAGTGYATAIVARLGSEVLAVESDTTLSSIGKQALADAGITNARYIDAPLPAGLPSEGPYDVILVEGAVNDMPAALLDQLKDGGRLVAIRIEYSTATSAVGRATIWTRTGMHTDARPAFDTAALILPGFERKYEFSL